MSVHHTDPETEFLSSRGMDAAVAATPSCEKLLSRLHAEIGEAHERFTILLNRIEPALRQDDSPPYPAEPRESRSPLSRDLWQAIDAVSELIRRIGNTAERVDL